MNEREFCYWLQGYFELVGVGHKELSIEQVETIKDHLALAMTKVTPDRFLVPPNGIWINPPADYAPYPPSDTWETTCSSTDVYNPTGVVASCAKEDDAMWTPNKKNELG